MCSKVLQMKADRREDIRSYCMNTDRILREEDQKYLDKHAPRSDVQAVVVYFKILNGYNKIRNWDDLNFARNLAVASRILKLCKGDLKEAFRAIDIISIWCEKQLLQWTLDTVTKHYYNFLLEKLSINHITIPKNILIYGGKFCEKGYPTKFNSKGEPLSWAISEKKFL